MTELRPHSEHLWTC